MASLCAFFMCCHKGSMGLQISPGEHQLFRACCGGGWWVSSVTALRLWCSWDAHCYNACVTPVKWKVTRSQQLGLADLPCVCCWILLKHNVLGNCLRWHTGLVVLHTLQKIPEQMIHSGYPMVPTPRVSLSAHQRGLVPGHIGVYLLVLLQPKLGLQHPQSLPVPSLSTPGALSQGECFESG